MAEMKLICKNMVVSVRGERKDIGHRISRESPMYNYEFLAIVPTLLLGMPENAKKKSCGKFEYFFFVRVIRMTYTCCLNFKNFRMKRAENPLP